MSKTVGTTIRMKPELKEVLMKLAKDSNQTQGSVIEGLLAKEASLDYAPKTVGANVQKLANGGVINEITTQDLTWLKELGVTTGAGIAGYYLSGFIRKQLEMDEDKGIQMLFGFVSGLLGLLAVQQKN